MSSRATFLKLSRRSAALHATSDPLSLRGAGLSAGNYTGLPAGKGGYSAMMSHSERYKWAGRVIERGRFNVNLRRVRRAAGTIASELWRAGGIRCGASGAIFTLLGALDGLEQRGGLDPAVLRTDRPWICRIKARLVLAVFVRWKDWLGASMWNKDPNRAGWNDYWMAVWFITGYPEHAHEIYTRAVAIPGPGADQFELSAAATARWMVSSVRAQHPDFDLAIKGLEQHYGVPVVSLVPPSPDYRPQMPASCSACGCPASGRAACNCVCHLPLTVAGRDTAN